MRVRRSLLFPLLLLCLAAFSHAQSWSGVLAPSRAINWANAGVSGGIPSNYTQCGSTIAAYSGTAGTINNAMKACPANTYVLLGAGVFNLSSYIQWNVNNVSLRGSGSNWNTGTRLVFGANAHAGGCNGVFADICIVSTTPNYKGGGEANIGNLDAPTGSCSTGSFAQGSTTLCLGTQTVGSTKPSVGTALVIDQLDDGTARSSDTGNIFACATNPVCTQGGEGANARSGRAMQQLVVVTAITSGTCSDSNPCTVTISPGLYMPNWRASQSPQAWWANGLYQTGSGLENLAIDASLDDATLGNLSAITTYNVQNCWVKNVHIERVQPEPVAANYSNKHIRMYQTHNCTVRDSYFHGRLGTDDYGIDPWVGDANLIENNIFDNIGTDEVIEGGNGNIFSYNFTVHNNWGTSTACNPDAQPCWAQAAMDGHGAQADYNLFEGNVAVGFQPENYFGENFFWTAFRSRVFGYTYPNIYQTVPVNIYGLSRYENLVGNVLGTSGYHTTYASYGGGNAGNCITSVYAIGFGGNCANGDGNTWPLDDTAANDGGNTNTTQTTLMRWGNYDVVNASNQFNSSEVPSTINYYSNPVPSSHTLPTSFYYASTPNWWPSGKTFPTIGPDITGGNVGQCSKSSSYPFAACRTTDAAGICGGGNSCGSAGIGGEAISSPAMDCYFGTMGGSPGGNYPTGSVLTNFDAIVCYGDPPPPPAPPTGLSAVVE